MLNLRQKNIYKIGSGKTRGSTNVSPRELYPAGSKHQTSGPYIFIFFFSRSKASFFVPPIVSVASFLPKPRKNFMLALWVEQLRQY